MGKVYAAIDLKSFYASVECNERNLDPLTTNLVVADESRTAKTICLAVSPSLKTYGLSGRARLFQVIQKVKEINAERLKHAPLGVFLGKSSDDLELRQNPNLELDFIIAPPRMQYYLDYSSKIYNTYLRHVSPDDIFAYSIDEVFCDITSYINKISAENFVTKIINDVKTNTGITATAGIGSNMFLAKVAMDVLAKHVEPNSSGVRIAQLNETTFREKLWAHTPITDIWRVGRGYTKRLAAHGMYTMGDVARCSIENEDLLYKLFGVNAEILIDHAWGYEPTTIAEVKQHVPMTKSLSSGQVLSCPYTTTQARTIIKEMAENLALELVQKNYVTDHLTLYINYDRENVDKLNDKQKSAQPAQIVTDHYGRRVPKPLNGTIRLNSPTSSSNMIIASFLRYYDEHTNHAYTIRKVTVAVNNLTPEVSERTHESNKHACKINNHTPKYSHHTHVFSNHAFTQADLFTNYAKLEETRRRELAKLEREHRAQKAVLNIRERYGKNSILRGFNFDDGATGRDRHRQIGGHKA